MVDGEVLNLAVRPVYYKSTCHFYALGGPGSHKGRIIDDLITSYKFKFISGENIIFEDFPKYMKAESAVSSTRDMKDFIAVLWFCCVF